MGKRFVNKIEDLARDKNIKKIWGVAFVKSIGFQRSLGFEPEGDEFIYFKELSQKMVKKII